MFRRNASGFNFLVGKEKINGDKFYEFRTAKSDNINNPLTEHIYGKSNDIKKCCLDYCFDE